MIILRTFFIGLSACIMLALLPAQPAQASHCGSPPDPRSYTAGYVSWCTCMGGIYNYQTTECSGATGHSGTGTPRASGWYCRAKAANGASGWARNPDRQSAMNGALGNCRSYAKGRRCTIEYCNSNGSASAPGPTAGEWYCRAKAANGAWGWSSKRDKQRAARDALDRCVSFANGRSCTLQYCSRDGVRESGSAVKQKKTATLHCSVCERKLCADVRAGWASARISSYVDQALAGYANCMRKAHGTCQGAQRQRDGVATCGRNYDSNASIKACLARVC